MLMTEDDVAENYRDEYLDLTEEYTAACTELDYLTERVEHLRQEVADFQRQHGEILNND